MKGGGGGMYEGRGREVLCKGKGGGSVKEGRGREECVKGGEGRRYV